MGSHGGQQNFPFGYIPNELHGIGLPDFMSPGPPPGQPLLSEHDTQNLDSFLNGFDTGGDASKASSVQQFQSNLGQSQEWVMPPTFVGSETSLRARNGAEWQNFQMSDFTFGNDMNLAAMPQTSDFHGGIHGHNFMNSGQYDQNLLHQLHDAAQTMHPSYGQGWQQAFQPPNVPQVHHAPRPIMRFGSDSHFQPTGYAAPENQFDHIATPSLDWLEAQSSAPNTQPNTEPNTEPSSPTWSKKRKLEEYQPESRRGAYEVNMNGYAGRANHSPQKPSSRQHKKPSIVLEQRPFVSQPPTPHQPTLSTEDDDMVDEDADADADADADVDYDVAVKDDDTRSVSPASENKTSRAAAVSKPARARKKSTASNATGRSKPKPSRSSTGNAPTARVPLTADQKKANHTNSEQRRRDATAKAYADLYDLVPELEEVGKQSTMKKLEIVVNKVHTVKNRVRQLRVMLGFDPDVSTIPRQADDHPPINTDSSRVTTSDIPTWSRQMSD